MLYNLFSECLSIKYKNAGVSASYATRKENETLYLFFEHSNGEEDWKNNLDFPVKPYKRMGETVWFAHRGFLKVWKEIEPMVWDQISDINFKKIIITGYSHGAAIALLCHEYIWYSRPDLRDSSFGFGFGCPRVLWGKRDPVIENRWKNFTVIRNIDDIVTHLPPAIFGYFHVGRLLKIGERGKYSITEAHYPENILTELEHFERNNRRMWKIM